MKKTVLLAAVGISVLVGGILVGLALAARAPQQTAPTGPLSSASSGFTSGDIQGTPFGAIQSSGGPSTVPPGQGSGSQTQPLPPSACPTGLPSQQDVGLKASPQLASICGSDPIPSG